MFKAALLLLCVVGANAASLRGGPEPRPGLDKGAIWKKVHGESDLWNYDKDWKPTSVQDGIAPDMVEEKIPTRPPVDVANPAFDTTPLVEDPRHPYTSIMDGLMQEAELANRDDLRPSEAATIYGHTKEDILNDVRAEEGDIADNYPKALGNNLVSPLMKDDFSKEKYLDDEMTDAADLRGSPLTAQLHRYGGRR